MKRVIKVLVASLLTLVISFAAFGCGSKTKKGLGYTIDRDNMFGICAVPDFGYSSSVDTGVTSEIICDLIEIMGVKSARVWMHIPYVLERERNSNKLKFKQSAVDVFHKYFADLKAAGVKNILVMNHFYLYPVEFLRPTHGGVVPEPGTDEYMIFMEMFRECYRMMSKEFPEITLWEPNNETDHPSGASVVRQGYLSGAENNAQYLYSMDEVALITADMCYYANLGIKENNPENELVMPGLVFAPNASSSIFIELMYEHIKSGKLPSSYDMDYRRKIPADTDTDNYFNVLNWHPYANTKPFDDWLQANIDMYNVAVKYGDNGKKLFLSEFGWHDSFDEKRLNDIGEWYPEAFDKLKAALPSLEAIYCFRMFNWISTGPNVKDMEKTFGIFTSPAESDGITPKPAAIGLFKYFNGKDADLTPLYKYSKTAS